VIDQGVIEGQVLGRYELLLRIAQGGMARVWAARLHGTRGFRKLVAVKTILPGVMDNERLERMFMEEATLASGLHHPNVVETLELGEQDGVLFMALEWVDGEPLSLVMNEAQKTGGVPLSVGVNLIAQACKGLHAAHELTDEAGSPLGIVHRDISPHNILVTYSGIAKVLDFGIAKATQRSSGLTEAGEVKGKLAYMAPEQVRGRPVDRRTDVFSLGTVLYALTTGHHPWKGDHPGATTERLCSDRPVTPPSAIVDDYPAGLEAVVLRALQKNADERFATAHDMLCALQDAVPDSLEANAEARVADFMSGLVGPRGVERRKRVRLAGELLDQRRALSGHMIGTGSSGSTSAVAMDRTGMRTGSTSGPLSIPRVAEHVAVHELPRRSHARFVWAAAALAAAAGIVLAVSQTSSGGSAAPASASYALPESPVPASATHANARPSAAPSAEPQVALAASADSEDDEKETTKSKSGASARSRSRAGAARAAVAVVPNAPAAVVAPSPAAPTSITPSATSAKSAAGGAGNAWNPNTFGNRQ
jgi:eukaryotic-like serine/threonine-protein kinase